MFLKISKIFYVFFMFYIMWFQPVFFTINNAPLILGLGMIGFLLLHKLSIGEELSFLITRPIFLWIIFTVYAFSTGYFVATNKILLINSIITYIQTIVMMIFIINLSKYEESNKFFVNSYATLAIIYALTLIFWGYDNKGIMTISMSSNPNSDGMTLLFGVFCILVSLDLKKLFRLTMSYISVGLLLYAVILTGSRKSFLAAVLLIMLWIILVFKEYLKFSSLKNKVALSFLIVVTVGFIVTKIGPLFYETALFARLTEGNGYEGDLIRVAMYKSAMEYFYENPFFGIGFNQFREFWGTYSHSTYAEIISTTGMIGTILYFTPYFVITHYLIRVYKMGRSTIIASQAILYIILMILMCSLAVGTIHFYGIRDSIMFALMISFCCIEMVKFKGKK
ncbi:TPA: O-antigen ligase family protein [Bacillus cereus]|nr:O-antigen ligase family protein [Bacillus cereus]